MLHDLIDFGVRPSGVYLGEIQMRGCRPVLIGPDGKRVTEIDPAVAELLRRVAYGNNQENREAN